MENIILADPTVGSAKNIDSLNISAEIPQTKPFTNCKILIGKV